MARIGVVKSTLGWLKLIPRTVELMHGMTGGGEGCGGGTGGQLRWMTGIPNTLSMPLGSTF